MAKIDDGVGLFQRFAHRLLDQHGSAVGQQGQHFEQCRGGHGDVEDLVSWSTLDCFLKEVVAWGMSKSLASAEAFAKSASTAEATGRFAFR